MVYSTDFFHHQDRARKASAQLVVYFCLAVFLIVIAIYAVIVYGLSMSDYKLDLHYGFFDPLVFILVAAVTGSIIFSATLYQLSKYSRGGGRMVAELLGGKLVDPASSELRERTLLNIVEEMSLASGVPVPPVYLLPEDGINAFAAGFSINDAVVAVTKGSLESLDREELQGVIAHEFSHILNGDMKLNLRLTGILYGLYVLAIIGYTLLRILGRGSSHSGSRRSSGGKKDKGGGGAILLVVLLAGFAFMVFGYIGEFIGKLIQRAISRQREFLADASAVQFTRNPQGITGALKKIGGFAEGSRVRSSHAKEMCHMFFADGLRNGFSSLMSTHPDLVTRIRRIEPSFSGAFQTVRMKRDSLGKSPLTSSISAAVDPAEKMSGVDSVKINSEEILMNAGTMKPEHVKLASDLVKTVPQELVSACREAYSARLVVFMMLIDNDEKVGKVQFDSLAPKLNSSEMQQLDRLLQIKMRLGARFRLPILELAMPALGQMSPSQYLDFIRIVHKLVEADNRISAFEFVVRQFVKKQYDRVCGKKSYTSSRSSRQILPEIVVLLSVLARQGAPGDQTAAVNAFNAGISAFQTLSGMPLSTVPMAAPDSNMFLVLDRAVDVLSAIEGKNRKAVMEACVRCVLNDELVSTEELELLRALGEMMGIPIPLLAGQTEKEAKKADSATV